MKLFEIVPENFFSILVSANREIYVDALMILHEEFTDKLNILTEDYLSTLIYLLEDRAYEIEVDDLEEEASSATSTGKARMILNRLIKTGWIAKEYKESSFTEILTPHRYAIPFLKLISELGVDQLEEYNSMVFATYSGLKQAEESDQGRMYEAVLSARKNTEQLQYALRTLYHGIRGFLHDMVDEHDVNQLIDDHFNQFRKLTDQYYHPIKTMDSVYRYMGPIQNNLNELLNNEDALSKMYQRAMKSRRYETKDQAKEEIHSAIDYVLTSYEGLDGLINEIDRKNSSYTKNSVERIRYLMNADQTVKGKLAEILKTYARSKGPVQDQVLERMLGGIHAQRQEFLDSGSLYHKNVRTHREGGGALPIQGGDRSLSDLAQGFILEHLNSAYTVSDIKTFVEGLFPKGHQVIEAKDIPISSDREFILLILTVIRHQDAGMNYSIEPGEGRIKRNGYWIPNLTIRKKEP